MSKTDLAFLALHVAVLMMSAIGIAAYDADPLSVAALLSVGLTLISGWRILKQNRTPERRREPQDVSVDAMDARTVLELDARLEALERRQADAEDAARWRALAASGVVSAPADATGIGVGRDARQPSANGVQ